MNRSLRHPDGSPFAVTRFSAQNAAASPGSAPWLGIFQVTNKLADLTKKKAPLVAMGLLTNGILSL